MPDTTFKRPLVGEDQDRVGTLPNFLIIGARKSGTTSLARYLGEHPEIFMARQKEVHYFDRHFDRGLDWYKRQFSGVQGEKAIGEATPMYMHWEDATVRMATTLPDAKLIAILRNPVARAYSQYWHEKKRGRESLSFADAVMAESKKLASGSIFELRYHSSYLKDGYYLSQLQRIGKFYPREAIHVVITEELSTSPIKTFHETCRFLGVDDTFIPANLGVRFNQYVDNRTKKHVRVAWKISNHSGLGQWIGGLLGRLNIFEYPPMDPSLREELVRYFEKENAALASWLGRDLSIWNNRNRETY